MEIQVRVPLFSGLEALLVGRDLGSGCAAVTKEVPAAAKGDLSPGQQLAVSVCQGVRVRLLLCLGLSVGSTACKCRASMPCVHQCRSTACHALCVRLLGLQAMCKGEQARAQASTLLQTGSQFEPCEFEDSVRHFEMVK